MAPCPHMGAGPWDACETVLWELWQAAGTSEWAGSEWLGPFPCCKPLQAGRHCQGQGVQPGQRGRKPSQLSALTASMETPPVGLFSVGCFGSALSLQGDTDECTWASCSQTLWGSWLRWEGLSTKGAGVNNLHALLSLLSSWGMRSRGVLFPGQAPLTLSVNWLGDKYSRCIHAG